MDRSRVLQQLQESQARLAKAEAELAEAAGKLRAWSEAGNHGPLDTVMGQDIEKAVVPDPHLLAVEMVNGTPHPAPWGNLKDGAPPMPPSMPWSTPDWSVWWSRFCDHTAGWFASRTHHMLAHATSDRGAITHSLRRHTNSIVPPSPL